MWECRINHLFKANKLNDSHERHLGDSPSMPVPLNSYFPYLRSVGCGWDEIWSINYRQRNQINCVEPAILHEALISTFPFAKAPIVGDLLQWILDGFCWLCLLNFFGPHKNPSRKWIMFKQKWMTSPSSGRTHNLGFKYQIFFEHDIEYSLSTSFLSWWTSFIAKACLRCWASFIAK